MKVAMGEILERAVRADEAGQRGLANALYEVAGRMDRVPGGDGFDDEEDRLAAIARGLFRARRAFAAEGMVAR